MAKKRVAPKKPERDEVPTFHLLSKQFVLNEGQSSGFQPPIPLAMNRAYYIEAIGVMASCPAGQYLSIHWEMGAAPIPLVLSPQMPNSTESTSTFASWQGFPSGFVSMMAMSANTGPLFSGGLMFSLGRTGLVGVARAAVTVWCWSIAKADGGSFDATKLLARKKRRS